MRPRLPCFLLLLALVLPFPTFSQIIPPHEQLIIEAFGHLRNGKRDQAVEAGRKAISVAETGYGPDHEKTAETQASVAFIELRAGNATQAETLFRKAILTRERLGATDTLPLAIAWCGLAQTLQSSGNTVEAESLFRKAVTLLDRAWPDGHQQTAVALEGLGAILSASERGEEAESLVTRALSIRERLWGSEDPRLIGSHYACALVCRRAGRFDAAAARMHRVVTLTERAIGSDSLGLADPLLNLADCLDTCERYDEAKPAYLRAISLQERHLGTHSIELANSLKSLALNRLGAGNMPEAESLLERAGAQLRLSPASFPLEIASVDFMLGSFARARGLFRKAADLYRASLALREKALPPDDPDTAATLNNLAETELQMGELEPAERHCREALRMRERSLGIDHPATQASMNSLAAMLVAANRNAEAEGLFTSSLASLERRPGENGDIIAIIINNLGELYRKTGRYQKAEEFCRRAYELRKRRHGENAVEAASSLASLAAAMEMNGRYAEAEAAFVKALEIKTRLLGGTHPEIAVLKGNLASLYEAMSRFSEAEPLLLDALAIRRTTLGENHPATALLLCRLGAFLFDQGRTASGLALQKQGCDILGEKLGEANPDRGTALCNLGACHARLGNLEQAEQALSEGIAIASAAFGAGHPNVTNGLNQLAEILRRRGNASQALGLLEQARQLQETTVGPEHPDFAITLSNLGILHMEAGQDEIARQYLERAASTLANSVGISDLNAIGCIEAVARLDDRQGRLLEGIAGHLRAISLEEENAVRNRSEQYAMIHRVRQSEPLSGFLSSLAKLSRLTPERARPFEETAFELMESCKSRRFIEQMSRSSAARIHGIPDAVRQRMREANAALQKTGQQLRQERRQPVRLRNIERLEELEDLFGTRLRELQHIETSLVASFPEYAALVSPERMTVGEARRELLHGNDRLLELWEGDGYLHAAIISSGSYRFVSHEISTETLRLSIVAFRKAVRALSDLATFKAASRGLAREILQPFLSDAEIRKTSRLIVIPSAYLANVPFEALILTDAGKDFAHLEYLFTRLPISYAPSVSALREIRRSEASRGSPRNATAPVLLVGDPAYASPETTSGTESGLTPLPGTRDEIARISALFQGDTEPPDIRLGAKASESFVKQASENGTLARFPIVHFAVHGIMPGQMAGCSEPCLALSTCGDASEDGFLNMSEILGLRLDAGLVVLSACNTGVVGIDLPNLEALSGFAQAFFHAGASRLLLTLWSISDTAAAEFMHSFYARLRRADRPLEALEEARKRMLSIPGFAHPFFWAPFILIGE